MNKDIPDEITVYTSESFKNDIGLTRGGILLLAILGGGDYDTVGLAGCGSHIALALAHCGFGDSLLQASENMAEAELEEFLIQWREDLRTELATNSRGFLRSKQNTLSTKIPETFPSLRVLSLYVQPTTSWSNGFVPPATDKWIVKLPALPELAVYCNKEFGWNPAAIAEKFRRLIFSGLCTRRLTMPLNIEQQIHNHVIKGRIQEEHPPLSAFVNILRVSPASEETSKKYQVKIVIGGLGQWSLSRLDAPSAAAASLSATTNEWIAAPLVERYFPLMVNAFNQALHLPLLPVPTAAVAPKYVEIPDSPEAQPVAKKWLGSIDLTNDKGEGGSVNRNAAGQAHGVIDLTADSDEDVEIIDLD
ncbi:hypothetical protein B0H14DRAFT_1180812 [Mycena olivaceomarginata]|nr:hypothetical protein B0H14DRAFT_1180812 [Mycena olivaceomarginata]